MSDEELPEGSAPVDDSFNDCHVMPDNSQHVQTKLCWCEPILQDDHRFEGGHRVWVHRMIH